MKIFAKTFCFTLIPLTLIALLAMGLIAARMPSVYVGQKQQTLQMQADRFVERLEQARQEDLVVLMGHFAVEAQANVKIVLGAERYAISLWPEAVLSGTGTSISTYVTVTEIASAYEVGDAVIIPDGTQTIGVYVSKGIADAMDGIETSARALRTQRNFSMEGQAGTFWAAVTLEPVAEAAKIILSLLPVAMLLCVLVSVVFSLLYARALTRPIKAISEVTRRMTALDREALCAVRTKDEIGALAANVNGLYGSLLRTIESLEQELQKAGEAERAQADFLRAASHELKTPVTAVSVILENMMLGVGKYKNHAEWLPKCKKLVDGLSAMLRETLAASRLGEAEEAPERRSIEAFYAEVLEPYALIARAKGLELYVDWSGAFPVTAPPKLLGRALSNVFANAVAYTAPDGRLAVYCRGRSLYVENECEPVPVAQLPRLFEPFYRPDASRSRETGGNGLGLYIIAEVLRRLALDYAFEPMDRPVGMRFVIHF